MPIYEYVCEQCNEPFEKLVMKSRETVVCPKCGGRRHTLQFSVIAAPAKSGATTGAGDAASGGCACTPSTCGCH